MLSEAHDGLLIFFWLQSWIKRGGCVPNKVATDVSRPLLLASAFDFTQLNIQKDMPNTIIKYYFVKKIQSF